MIIKLLELTRMCVIKIEFNFYLKRYNFSYFRAGHLIIILIKNKILNYWEVILIFSFKDNVSIKIFRF